MVNKILTTRLAILLVILLALVGCDFLFKTELKDNRGVSVSIGSNAVFSAYKDGTKGWQVTNSKNGEFAPHTTTFTVADPHGHFSLMFVCPNGDFINPRAHQVYIYHATLSELQTLSHLCRKSEAAVERQKIFGSVGGMRISDGQKARLALGDNSGSWVYEAYAFEAIAGRHDFLGFVGDGKDDGTVTPTLFYKQASVSLGADQPKRHDIDFKAIGHSGIQTSIVPPAAETTAQVTGVPSNGKWESYVGFRSENKAFIKLAESKLASFSYFGFPVYVNGLESAGLFQLEGEGHEFTAMSFDDSNRIVARTSSFFGEPQNLLISLPNAVGASPSVSSEATTKGTKIVANWGTYTDPNYGDASLYYWKFKGSAAKGSVCEDCGSIKTDTLEWHVLATPGWVGVSGATSINIEPIVNIAEGWAEDWNFQLETPLSWILSSYVSTDVDLVIPDDATNAERELLIQNQLTPQELLLNHLFNQEYFNGLTYAVWNVYSP